MKNGTLLILPLLLFSCGNKSRETESIIYDESFIEQTGADTVADSVLEESPKTEEKPSVPASLSSSSRTHKSSNYDNMRGFDPVSEDDMDDNGMSRYMENNDEEGWD